MATQYNQVLTTDLDVIPLYKELMSASTEVGSIYLKVKETITDYVDKGDLTAKERAEIVAKTIAFVLQELKENVV